MASTLRTGYVIPIDALQRYLTEGHGETFKNLHRPPTAAVESEEGDGEEVMSEEEARLWEDLHAFSSYKLRFRCIRRQTPWEVRTKLEIPYSFIRPVGNCYKQYLFIPTGFTTKEQLPTTTGPSDSADRAVMTLFIETANGLLPDGATRSRAGFSLDYALFVVISRTRVLPPCYTEEEDEEIIELRRTQTLLARRSLQQCAPLLCLPWSWTFMHN